MVFVELILLSMRKAAVVIIIYVARAIRVICGAIWDTRIIHPKWAIEE